MSPPSPEQTAPSGSKRRHGLKTVGPCLVGAGVVAACVPWPVSSPRLVAVVADELARSYGIALAVEGATEVALLPVPRLNFARARLTSGTPGGAALAEGGSLTLELSLISLMTGRIDLHALALDGAAVTLPMSATDRRWAVPARKLVQRIGTEGDARRPRLGLTRATVTGWNPRDGTIETVRGLDLTLSSPLWGTAAELAARGTWRRQEARLRVKGLQLAALLGGGASPFSATATWPAGTLTAKGSARLGEVCCEVSGRARLATRSLPETLGWTGGGVALAPLIEEVAVEADFKAAGKDLLLPRMRVTLGGNQLEGAGSVSFADDRPAMQATLAAESLDVAPLVGDLIQALGLGADAPDAQGWARRPFALAPFTGGDLDLRLSAANTRVGPVLVEDVASSLIVRKGSVEASLGRASLQGGTVKGRVVLGETKDGNATDVRAQGAFDGLDLGALLVDVGEVRWLVGAVNGTFALESRASTMGELVGHLGGRASVGVEDGALTGLDLAAVMQRDQAGPPVQRIGRTDFGRAGFGLRFKDGLGAITEGTLVASDVVATMAGTISLPDRRVEARAELAPAGRQGPVRLFDVVGPWSAVVVRPREAFGPEADPRSQAIVRPDTLRVPANARIPASARAYAP